jgi:hypothetical protein
MVGEESILRTAVFVAVLILSNCDSPDMVQRSTATRFECMTHNSRQTPPLFHRRPNSFQRRAHLSGNDSGVARSLL